MPIVNLYFPALGITLPSDHGYALYSSLAQIVPALHAPGDVCLGMRLRGEKLRQAQSQRGASADLEYLPPAHPLAVTRL